MLNTPLQKEREIRTNIALNVLSDMESKEACPEWIGRFIADYTKDSYYAETVLEAKVWVEKFSKEHHRRCQLIQREDFLPMILYVAQKQYQSSIEQKESRYEQEKL